MTPDPHTLPVSASVLDALSQLEGSGYRNVPVVRQSGERSPRDRREIAERSPSYRREIAEVSPRYRRGIAEVSPRTPSSSPSACSSRLPEIARDCPRLRETLGEPVGVLDILALIRGALHQMPGTGSDASETGSVINGSGRASLTNGAVSAAADEPDAVVMAPGQPRGSAEEERAQAAV
jgi:CBS domain-containing protein